MKCPYKENQECYKKAGKYILVGFLAVLGISIGLKIITMILLIFPGNIADNTWLVIVSTVIVILLSIKYCYKKSKCNPEQLNTEEN
jgi:hypothetical protein